MVSAPCVQGLSWGWEHLKVFLTSWRLVLAVAANWGHFPWSPLRLWLGFRGERPGGEPEGSHNALTVWPWDSGSITSVHPGHRGQSVAPTTAPGRYPGAAAGRQDHLRVGLSRGNAPPLCKPVCASGPASVPGAWWMLAGAPGLGQSPEGACVCVGCSVPSPPSTDLALWRPQPGAPVSRAHSVCGAWVSRTRKEGLRAAPKILALRLFLEFGGQGSPSPGWPPLCSRREAWSSQGGCRDPLNQGTHSPTFSQKRSVPPTSSGPLSVMSLTLMSKGRARQAPFKPAL